MDIFLEIRSQILPPTFVIVPRGTSRNRSRLGSICPAPLDDAPMLEVDPDDGPEAMLAEVLAACQASRAMG
jgi:hypothetical protein